MLDRPIPPSMAATGAARRALPGFLLVGLLGAITMCLLPAWGYHRSAEFAEVGAYFFALGGGVVVAFALAPWLLAKAGTRPVLIGSLWLASAVMTALIFLEPPQPALFRQGATFILGADVAFLTAALFVAIRPSFIHAPASTLNLIGVLISTGCVAASLLVSLSIEGSALWTPEAVVAGLSAAGALLLARMPEPEPMVAQPASSGFLADVTSARTLMMAVLLYFQFGGEWSIAGWLPIFAVQRLGESPRTGLLLLALYLASLGLGRVLWQSLLTRMRPAAILSFSVGLAMFGCLVLSRTNNLPGASIAVLSLGGASSAMLPLALGWVGRRFSPERAVMLRGAFFAAFFGASVAPGLVGVLAAWLGVAALVLVPLIATLVVALLVVGLAVEARWNPDGI